MVRYEGIVTSEGILKLPEIVTLDNERDDSGKYRGSLLRESEKMIVMLLW